MSRSTSSSFDDVALVEDDEGTLHVIGCEDDATYLTWLHASACHAVPRLRSRRRHLGRRRRRRRPLPLGRGLAFHGSSSPWNVDDAETSWGGTALAFASAEGSDGAYAFLDPDDNYLPVSDARAGGPRARLARRRMYVAVADGGSRAWLYWGDPAAGFDSVELDIGLPRVDDLDVHVADGDVVVMAVRGADQDVYGAMAAYGSDSDASVAPSQLHTASPEDIVGRASGRHSASDTSRSPSARSIAAGTAAPSRCTEPTSRSSPRTPAPRKPSGTARAGPNVPVATSYGWSQRP